MCVVHIYYVCRGCKQTVNRTEKRRVQKKGETIDNVFVIVSRVLKDCDVGWYLGGVFEKVVGLLNMVVEVR